MPNMHGPVVGGTGKKRIALLLVGYLSYSPGVVPEDLERCVPELQIEPQQASIIAPHDDVVPSRVHIQRPDPRCPRLQGLHQLLLLQVKDTNEPHGGHEEQRLRRVELSTLDGTLHLLERGQTQLLAQGVDHALPCRGCLGANHAKVISLMVPCNLLDTSCMLDSEAEALVAKIPMGSFPLEGEFGLLCVLDFLGLLFLVGVHLWELGPQDLP
mmetsp:Transcript_16357/g.36108  ORF Transcript_16357/g.36108 Transcript_16357/m.36108 type:complete len:213 (-) Transcript_16357:1686-2324(-)